MLFHRDAHVPNHDDRFIQPSDPAMGSASDSPAMIVQRRRMSTDHFHSIATAPTQSVTTPDRVRQRLFADIGELPATPVAALNLRDDRVSVMANMAPDAEHSGDHVKFEHAVDTMNDHSMDVDIGHGHDDDYSTPDTQLASQHKENCYSITTFPPSTGTSATHSDSPLVTVAREQKRRMRNALESLPLVVPAVSKRTPRPVLRDGPTSTVSTASLFVTPPRAQLAFRGVMNGEVAQSRVGTAATVASLDTPNLLKHGMEFDQQNFIERALAWQQPEWKDTWNFEIYEDPGEPLEDKHTMSGMFPPPSTPSIHNSAKGNSFSKRMGNTQSKSNEVVASSTNLTTLEDVSVTTQRPFSHDQLNQLWESALTIMSPRHKRARAG